MNVTLKRFAAACGLVVLLAAPDAALAQAGPVAHVAIGFFGYNPTSVHVRPGTTITWTNDTWLAHTVTTRLAPGAGFNSGAIPEDGTFSVTLWAEGQYVYYSELNPNLLRGNVFVESAAP